MTTGMDIQRHGAMAFSEVFARLATIVQREFEERLPLQLLVAFRGDDAARGNAILSLFKQFGIFPTELYSPGGAVQESALESILCFDGLTIVIQAIPAIPPSLFINDHPGASARDDQQVIPLVPAVTRVQRLVPPAALNSLAEQFISISHAFEQQDESRCRGVAYLSGLSVVDVQMPNPMLGEAYFLPAYLLTRRAPEGTQVYQQQDLQQLIATIAQTPPRIADLEYCLSQVDEVETAEPPATAMRQRFIDEC